jgi:nucleoside-diphosphate-sugar epimerase
MNIKNSTMYQEELNNLAKENVNYKLLKNKSILVTGARGLIGSYLIDLIMLLNENKKLNCKVYALGLSSRGKERFKDYLDNPLFEYIEHDVNTDLELDEKIDYVIHLASNTHPMQYAKEPIKTITTNVLGTYNLLNFAVKKNVKRFVFASSVEIYGENKKDVELFDEDYCGYINSNTLRAGYPEGKRCGEALCQAYKEEKELDVVIPRFSRIYGPTILKDDSKAISQFLFKALNNEDIVLKSEGKQHYSYTYVYDAVYALLLIMLNGENGEAYNISYPETDKRLFEIADIIASTVNKKVVFDLPSEAEKKGFSKATIARMDNTKLKNIGFNPKYDMEKGIKSTLAIIKEANNE